MKRLNDDYMPMLENFIEQVLLLVCTLVSLECVVRLSLEGFVVQSCAFPEETAHI